MSKKVVFWCLIVALSVSVIFNIVLYSSKPQEAPQVLPPPQPTKNAKTAPASTPRPELPEIPSTDDNPRSSKQAVTNLVFSSIRLDETHQADGKRFSGRLHVYLNYLSHKAVIKPSDIQFSTKNIKIESVTVDDDKLTICGDFPIKENVEMTLPKGILLKNGLRSQDTFAFSVKLTEPSPYLRFTEKGPYYPMRHTNGKLASLPIRIQCVNVTSVQASLWRCENKNLDISNNLIWSYEDLEKQLLLKAGEKSYAINIPANTTGQATLDLAQLGTKLTPGIYCLGVSAITKENPTPGTKYIFEPYHQTAVQDCIWLFVSDLGVTATLAPNSIAVSVLSLQDNTPVNGAQVALYSLKRQTIATGFTNANGCAILQFNASYQPEKNPPHTLIVKNGSDITRLRLTEQNQTTSADFNNTGTHFKENQAFIYTERGIYRPGETIQASVIVRHREKEKLQASKLPITLKLRDAKNNTIFEKQIHTNDNGFATTEIALSPVAITGTYSIEAGVGNDVWNCSSIQVGSFVPDRIKLTLKPVQKLLKTNEAIQFKYSADYYFGVPVENAKTKGVLLTRHTKAPHWKEYAVGQKKDYSETCRLATLEPNYIAPYSNHVIKLPSLSQLQAKKDDEPSRLPVNASLVFSVAEEGGQSVSATANAIILPRTFYLGLKQLPDANHVAQVEAKLLSWDVQPQTALPASSKIKLTLVRKEWKYVLAQNGHAMQNEWQEVETSRQELEPALMLNGIAKIPLPTVQDGAYELTANYEGQLTTLAFYHWWGEDDSTRSTNPNILHVTTDKTEYAPGDEAALTFSSRAAGQCIAVIGEENLTQSKNFPVVAGKNTIRLTVPSQMTAGTAFVQLVLATPYKNNYTSCFAQLKLRVNQEKNRLKLNIETAATAEPEQELPITIKATDSNGKPQAATVQLVLVDEGILSLTNYQLPDIFAFFHGVYYHNYSCYHLYNSLFSRINENQKAGGDAAGANLRIPKLKLMKNAIVILPPLELGEEGLYHTKVKLPRHTGELRLMAVATSKVLVGSCQQSLKLSEAASILPSVPVAVAEKDQFTATFALFNNRLETSQATFTMEAKGFSTQPLVKTLQLPKGKRATVQFKLQAPRNGSFTLPYSLTLGKQTFKGECLVNVRSLMPYTTRSSLQALQPGESIQLPAPKTWQSIAERQLNIASSPALALPMALKWLQNYPYGCLEQTTSCAFPFLAMSKLQKAGLLPPNAENLANEKLDLAVVKLLGMQRSSRGFTSWPDVDVLWTDASVYAAHFLLKSQSRFLTADRKKQLAQFLKDALKSSSALGEKAYILYVLSLSDNTAAIHAKALEILENVNASSTAHFFAAAALYRANYASEAMPYLEKALNDHAWENQDYVQWILQSPATRTGMILAMAMDFLPQHPACIQMALYLNTLLQKDNTAWGTTRDNAWSIIGLAAFTEKYATGKAAINLKTNNSNENLDIAKPLSRKLDAHTPIKITNSGSAAIFIQENIGGIPSQIEQQKNAVIHVLKEYLDANGKPVTSVKHGDLITVRVTFTSKAALPNGILLDLLPGGFQIENASLATRAGNDMAQKAIKRMPKVEILRQDSREDRYLLFFAAAANRTYGISYTLRAVTPGTFAIPPTQIEDMYQPQIQGHWNTPKTMTIQ